MSLFQGDDGYAGFAFAVPAETEAAHARMAAQAILYTGAQNAGSVSVNDADLAERGEHRVVDEFFDLGNRFIQLAW